MTEKRIPILIFYFFSDSLGGHDGPLVRKSCEVYDPETNTWTPIAGKQPF